MALLIAGLAGWPFWPFAVAGGLVLATMALGCRWVSPREAAATVAWGLPPFVVGMYVVVAAVYRAIEPVVTELPGVAAGLPGPLPVIAAVVATAAGANVVNNLPLSLAAIQLLRTVPAELVSAGGLPLREALAFGTLIGVNLGPNLTITGSLATMLCLAGARRAGVEVTPWEFARAGLVAAVLPMGAAALTVWVLLRGA